MKDSIKALRELEKRLYAYQYAMAVADYDSETVAPPESSAGRAEAMEVLSRAYFDQLVSADTAALLQRATPQLFGQNAPHGCTRKPVLSKGEHI